MSKISLIGNDMSLDDGIGTCGKEGQGVPVGVGQPTLLMGGITVGVLIPIKILESVFNKYFIYIFFPDTIKFSKRTSEPVFLFLIILNNGSKNCLSSTPRSSNLLRL